MVALSSIQSRSTCRRMNPARIGSLWNTLIRQYFERSRFTWNSIMKSILPPFAVTGTSGLRTGSNVHVWFSRLLTRLHVRHPYPVRRVGNTPVGWCTTVETLKAIACENCGSWAVEKWFTNPATELLFLVRHGAPMHGWRMANRVAEGPPGGTKCVIVCAL